MVRTALLGGALAAIVASSWARLEQPRPELGELVLVASLAVAPALVRGRLRIVAAAIATLVAGSVALDVPLRSALPFDDRDIVASVVSRTWQGFLSFSDVTVPFEGIAQPLMHGAVLMAVFVFSLAGALAVAARKPPLAVAALLLGAGWPATMLPGDNELTRGLLILAVGLVLLAAVRPGPLKLRSQALAGGAVVVLALTLSASGAVAKNQFVDWQSWDFYNKPDAPVGVSYVWRADYDGVKFPNKRTRVLEVRGSSRASYWRATTLDSFAEDHWDEDLASAEPLQDDTRADFSTEELALMPSGANDTGNWTRADVTVQALRDRHLVGPSVPIAYDTRRLPEVEYASGAVAIMPRPVARGDEYTAWGFAPRPKPSVLAKSPAVYPELISEAGYYRTVERGTLTPVFGDPGREQWAQETFAFDRSLRAYQPLYERALRIAGNARNPYAATVALEAWFRTGGRFTYDESPPRTFPGVPPLVFFLEQSKAGYCQHYAGAMALMLRYLGIPSRVAAGFTSGTFDRERRVWNVSDRNAHTWVEVWFHGFGWLPFDPTPGRGNLSGPYSASSFSFDAPGARDVLAAAGLAAADQLLRFQLARGQETSSRGTPRDLRPSGEQVGGGGGISRGAIVALVLLGLAFALVLGKLVLRRSRYFTRDPRRLAGAYRQELVDFLADQRVDVPASATLDELRALVVARTGVDARRLVETLGLARFGPASAAAAAAKRARGELRLVRRRLRRSLSAGERLRGAFSVRSLLAR
jgi:transglutaminase-like putative cysteine protease